MMVVVIGFDDPEDAKFFCGVATPPRRHMYRSSLMNKYIL